MVRAFIGIVLPEDIKSYVINIQKQLESLPISAKFVEPENFHISLSFLGDVTDDETETIKSELDGIAQSYEEFDILLGDVTLFPNEKFIRVIAVDVKSDILEQLRKEIARTIGGKFNPSHFTLARVNQIADKKKFLEGVDKIVGEGKIVRVNSIEIIQSVLQKSGPVYTVLHESYLR